MTVPGQVSNSEWLSQPFIELGAQLAVEQDIQELAALINAGFQYQDAGRGRARVTERELQTRIYEDPFYVLKEAGRIIATVTTYPDDDSLLHFGLLVIEERKRGQKIGEKMVHAVELDAAGRGYSGVSLGYFAVASHLKDYYERLGYKVTGENYTWEGLEVTNMIKHFEGSIASHIT